MDNPFSGDNGNPFQTPYQQAPQAAPGIKPFKAVDLAPPAGLNGPRHNSPGNPTGSTYTDGDFGSAFLSRESFPAPASAPFAAGPAPQFPVPAAPTAPLAAPHPATNVFSSMTPAPVTHTFSPKPPAPAPMPDFSPVPMAHPAPARQSQILSVKDFNDAMSQRKPEFFLTTTQQADWFPIRQFLGVVSVEIIIPKDLLFRNPAPHGEMHRLKAAEDQLQKVKTQAFQELGDKARLMGADAVVGCTLAFSNLDAIVFLCSAVGTAVKLAD
ncbi:MAG: heavy metal-binding domain-containing protein [Fibrobacteria bacterium]